jgi:hypothetical protein
VGELDEEGLYDATAISRQVISNAEASLNG